MISIRRLIERLSGRPSFRLSLSTEFGRTALCVSPDTQLKYYTPGLAGLDPKLLSNVKELATSGLRFWT
jgi:hypothetical protein